MRNNSERTERIIEKTQEETRKRRKRITVLSATACTLAAVLTFGLVLFVPYDEGRRLDLAQYRDSEYYPIIEQLGALTYGEPSRTNNFEKLMDSLFAVGSNAPVDEGDSTGAPLAGGQIYEEVTDNQTEGVTEGDLLKRSNQYLYYLDYADDGSAYVLRVYSAAGKQVSTYTVRPESDTGFFGYYSQRELYLSADCRTVTIVSPCYNTAVHLLYTVVIGLDVSDPTDVREISRSYVSGQAVSSRTVGDTLLLVSNFAVRWNPDFSDEAQFLPQIGTKDGFESLPLEDIVCPDAATRAEYTVICSLDANTLAVRDCLAFLSYSDEVYVSAENLYVLRGYTANVESGSDFAVYPATEIVRVSYGGEELELSESYTVTGSVLNRYCMDEYEGVLRVVTTTWRNEFRNGQYLHGYAESADLICIELGTAKELAHITRFAPDGETVQSARFYGDTAYVCTAFTFAELTDPVYQFDLSDYSDISYLDTGTIPGYSLSLTAFAENTLLGIGYGESRNTLKIELYRENGPFLSSLAVFTAENATFSDEYHAYYIDAEHSLIGLGVCRNGRYEYLLLRFDGYQLVEIGAAEANGELDDMRACYESGSVYYYGHDLFGNLSI